MWSNHYRKDVGGLELRDQIIVSKKFVGVPLWKPNIVEPRDNLGVVPLRVDVGQGLNHYKLHVPLICLCPIVIHLCFEKQVLDNHTFVELAYTSHVLDYLAQIGISLSI